MSTEIKNLSAANIKYLLALIQLDVKKDGIKCIDIAEALKVSKSSVHEMMKTMDKMGLVSKPKYGTVFLTEKGKSLASLYNDYYLVICAYFQKALFAEKNVAKTVAVLLISEISIDGLEIICNKMKNSIIE